MMMKLLLMITMVVDDVDNDTSVDDVIDNEDDVNDFDVGDASTEKRDGQILQMPI